MKISQRFIAFVLSVIMICTVAGGCIIPASAQTDTYNGVNITHHEGGYDSDNRVKVTHSYDFSIDRLSYYTTDEALAIGNRTSIIVSDGKMTCKEGKNFCFGSSVCLGDDYGLDTGVLKYELCLTGGNVTLGTRTSKTCAKTSENGIWLTFDGSGKVKISVNNCGMSAEADFPFDLSKASVFSVNENTDNIEYLCNDKVFLKVLTEKSGKLSIYDINGNLISETEKSKLPVTGYWELYVDSLAGYIKNISFTNVELDRSLPTTDAAREIDYSTWTATDDLGRTIADNTTAGDVNSNRYVGLFYFLCWVGAGVHVQDNTKLYLELGLEGFNSYFNQKKGGEAYWAEPYLGYYRNTDEWVYRKHAYMLEAAGIDFIFLDVSNQQTFIQGHTVLFDTWLQIRREGGMTPQIVFFNGDSAETFETNMKTLFTSVYSDGTWDKYKELFFMWEGKPLVFGNSSGVTGELSKKINEKFTVRSSWAWSDHDNYWCWLQEYTFNEKKNEYGLVNGGWGRDANGKYEALAISIGHHPTMNKGRSFVFGTEQTSGLRDYGFSMTAVSKQGLGFASQFTAASYLIDKNVPKDSPFVLMITGWNEWISGCSYLQRKQSFTDTTTKFAYVDQFNCEYSRDAEPMRDSDGYGIGDSAYYQLIDAIRKYKGVDATPSADNQKTVDIYKTGSFDDINQTYMDTIGDTALRNTMSYDADIRYINNTGRNDFDYAKISQDSENLYFLVSCVNDIVIDDGENWMNLFLDTDNDASTGWCGYDYIINRDRDSYLVSVGKFDSTGWTAQTVGGAYYRIDGKNMTVRISKSLLGISKNITRMNFKWADNSVTNGDATGFMDLGDTAPNDRYSFAYICESCAEVDRNVKFPKFGRADVQATGDGGKGHFEDTGDIGSGKVTPHEVDVSFSFDDYEAGSYLSDNTISEYFEYLSASADSFARVTQTDNGNIAYMTGCNDLRTWDDVTGVYTFSIDLKVTDTGNNAVYVRGEMPGSLIKYNPKHSELAGQDIYMSFPYYESDWYVENGGRTGGSSVAGSGLGIYTYKDGIELRVKRYVDDGLTVASIVTKLPYPDGYMPEDEFFNLRFEDDCESIRIFFNDELFSVVSLENPGKVYESDGTGQEYFGHVVISDANGKEVLSVDNTRLNSTGSQIAVTTRFQAIRFDNIHIVFNEMTTEFGTERESKYINASGSPAYTPSVRLLDTLKTQFAPELEQTTGDDTVNEETTEITTAETSENTGTTEITTQEIKDPDNTEEITVGNDTTTDTGDAVSGGCGSVLTSVLLPLAACAGVILTVRQDKKSRRTRN